MAVKRGPNPAGPIGNAKQPDSTYLFGTPEEINNRVNTGYDHPPQEYAPHFVQIGPGNTGQSVDDNANRRLRAGNLKFSGGPR